MSPPRRSRRLEWENSSDLFAPRHSITEGAVHIIDDIESAMAEASQGQHAIEASLSLYSLEATQSQQAQAHALVLAPASSLKIGMTSADDTVCVLSPSAVLTARTAHCNLAEGQGEGDVSVSQEEEGDDIETLQSIQSVSPLKPAQGGNSDDIESVQGVQDEVRHLARAAVRHMVHTHITTHARTHTHTHIHIHTRTHARTRAHAHPRTHAQMHTQTHTPARTHAHALRPRPRPARPS